MLNVSRFGGSLLLPLLLLLLSSSSSSSSSSTFALPLAEQSPPSSDTVQVPRKALYAAAPAAVIALGAAGYSGQQSPGSFAACGCARTHEAEKMQEIKFERGVAYGHVEAVRKHEIVYYALDECKQALRDLDEWKHVGEYLMEEECRRRMGAEPLLTGKAPSLLHTFMSPGTVYEAMRRPRPQLPPQSQSQSQPSQFQLLAIDTQRATRHTLRRLAATVHLQKLATAWRPLMVRMMRSANAAGETGELERVAARG
ncbi:MAG: hypothetical protein M1826_004039 [Phylliscum demangeonii]|nr:MAG: hypothetical protein M1826_004039 [Phylliscum demangeonii]